MHCIQNTVEITILLYINFIPLCCKVSYVLFYCNTFHPRRRRHVATSSPICVWTFQSTPPAKAETAIIHNNSYHFLSNSNKQVIQHPLQIPENMPKSSQYHPHYTIFLVRIPLEIHVCFRFAPEHLLPFQLLHIISENQWFLHINSLTNTNMVHFCSMFIP